MKTITVKLLNSNSTQNKNLLDYLKNSLRGIIVLGYKFQFTFAKSDGKTTYPRILIDRQQYIGLSDIRVGISRLVNLAKKQQTQLIGEDDQIHRHQLNNLYDDDDDDDDSMGGIDDRSIQRKMAAFKKRQGNRGPAADDSGSEIDIPKVKSKKRRSKSSVTQHKKKNKARGTNSGPKKERVVEQMVDDDIGGTFGSLAGHSKDDGLMENMFVNMQESPV